MSTGGHHGRHRDAAGHCLQVLGRPRSNFSTPSTSLPASHHSASPCLGFATRTPLSNFPTPYPSAALLQLAYLTFLESCICCSSKSHSASFVRPPVVLFPSPSFHVYWHPRSIDHDNLKPSKSSPPPSASAFASSVFIYGVHGTAVLPVQSSSGVVDSSMYMQTSLTGRGKHLIQCRLPHDIKHQACQSLHK